MGDRQIGPHEADHDGSSAGVRSSDPDEGATDARWDDDGGFEPSVTAPRLPTAPGHATGDNLFLRGVLDSALPHTLGTDDQPELYTVAAVFSRRVSAEERDMIEHPRTAATLSDRGYPGVALHVADRRLEIAQTNLAMLSGGLAAEIAELLRDIEQRALTARERRDDELRRWSEAETARAARVKAEADRVRFE